MPEVHALACFTRFAQWSYNLLVLVVIMTLVLGFVMRDVITLSGTLQAVIVLLMLIGIWLGIRQILQNYLWVRALPQKLSVKLDGRVYWPLIQHIISLLVAFALYSLAASGQSTSMEMKDLIPFAVLCIGSAVELLVRYSLARSS